MFPVALGTSFYVDKILRSVQHKGIEITGFNHYALPFGDSSYPLLPLHSASHNSNARRTDRGELEWVFISAMHAHHLNPISSQKWSRNEVAIIKLSIFGNCSRCLCPLRRDSACDYCSRRIPEFLSILNQQFLCATMFYFHYQYFSYSLVLF